jgi:hypothetical protein
MDEASVRYPIVSRIHESDILYSDSPGKIVGRTETVRISGTEGTPATAGMPTTAVTQAVAVTPATSNSKDDSNSMTAHNRRNTSNNRTANTVWRTAIAGMLAKVGKMTTSCREANNSMVNINIRYQSCSRR